MGKNILLVRLGKKKTFLHRLNLPSIPPPPSKIKKASPNEMRHCGNVDLTGKL